ncbi:riboflavin biosynthesis protein RibF (plasmid) [Aminobacter sp. Y103A]|uniref:hypothetical protein n=1 Tax=Aminobacter sp. Y103A TaxID=1870862 RepID=UPI002573512A|nr:hypothetical protein [Aminobacter sp. SS-2016]BBD41050.1 riboflavin biosynthesis protein RibF [Aminobacter sp. SS-2016]
MSATLPTYPLPRCMYRLPEVVGDGLPAGHALRGSVLVLGNFDGFHLGHQALARMANELAAGHPMAVMSCEPHPRSFFSQDQAPFRLATPTAKRLELGVRHVIAGPDFRFGHNRAGDMALLAELGADRGIRVSVAPDVTHAGVRISSTLIRSAIEAGDVSGAVRLMGTGTLYRPGRGRWQASAHEIGADGAFRPLGPHCLPAPRQMWRLEGQVGRRRNGRPFAA